MYMFVFEFMWYLSSFMFQSLLLINHVYYLTLYKQYSEMIQCKGLLLTFLSSCNWWTVFFFSGWKELIERLSIPCKKFNLLNIEYYLFRTNIFNIKTKSDLHRFWLFYNCCSMSLKGLNILNSFHLKVVFSHL